MKKYSFPGSVVLLALAFSAPAAAATWSGAYGGGNIGYGWGKADTTVIELPNPAAPLAVRTTTLNPKPDGGVLGAQIGYNWQNGNTVTGVEGDLSFADMRGTAAFSPIILNNGPLAGGIISTTQKIDWYGTLRGRIGFATPNNWLIYATGGLAFGGTKFSGNVDFVTGGAGTEQYPASSSKTKTGWTLGVGGEWAMSATSSIKAEYLHIDLGGQSVVGNPTIPFRVGATQFQMLYDWKTRADILRIGMNFKF